MSVIYLYFALMIAGYGDENIIQKIKEKGGVVYRSPGSNSSKLTVIMPPATTDVWLEDVYELRGLECLSLSRTSVTDKGLKKLFCLRALRGLVLSPENSDDGLRQLEVLTNLEVLNAEYCPKITEEGIAHFKKAIPNCKVYYREEKGSEKKRGQVPFHLSRKAKRNETRPLFFFPFSNNSSIGYIQILMGRDFETTRAENSKRDGIANPG